MLGQMLKGTAWNFVGLMVPLAAAVVAIPLLLQDLGPERFGVLALAWSLVGYFSLFDLGLSRALTHAVAGKIGNDKDKEIPGTVLTLSLAMLCLGGGALVVVMVGAHLIASHLLSIPRDMQAEIEVSIRIIAISIPFVTTSSGMRGVLEAFQRFDMVNLVRMPLGAMTFLGPLVILPFGGGLPMAVSTLVLARVAAWIAYVRMCRRTMPGWRWSGWQSRQLIQSLRFGGWMTVTNVVGPVMDYLDRFLIATVLGLAAVAYYTTPYEIVTKLLVIPGAIVTTLFPMFTRLYVGQREQSHGIYLKALKYSLILLFVPCLTVICFSSPGLHLWLGARYSDVSVPIAQLLALGVMINGVGQVCFAVVQGAGRPDATAKLHLVELPVYLAMFWEMTSHYGVAGAAMAWTLRVAVDALALYILAHRVLGTTYRRDGWRITFVLLGILAIALPMATGWEGLKYYVMCLAGFLGITWRYVLEDVERRAILGFMPKSR